jgi:hypothetical protein
MSSIECKEGLERCNAELLDFVTVCLLSFDISCSPRSSAPALVEVEILPPILEVF